MPYDHPDPQLLERFMRNEASVEERRWIVRHLLAGCAQCGTITRRLWELGEPGPRIAGGGRPEPRPQRSLDAERNPAAIASSLYRLALLLAARGRGEAALQALHKARRLYGRLSDGPNLARVRHLEGKIGESSGSPAEVEAAFLDAHRGFLLAGMGAEAAAVLLDLAVFYTREGRPSEILPLTDDMLPIFQAPDLRRGVAAALVYFRAVVESGRATVGLLEEVARYVKPAEGRDSEAPAVKLLW
jgi:hypothetical protein